MEYYRNGVKHKFDTVLNDVDFQLFLNGELNGTIIEEEIVVIELTTEEKLLKDIEFGKLLIKTFLTENRDIVRPFTMNENLNLLNKFAAIETLSRLGDIKTILAMIEFVETDEIFTQERKDNFILTIKNYLN